MSEQKWITRETVCVFKMLKGRDTVKENGEKKCKMEGKESRKSRGKRN